MRPWFPNLRKFSHLTNDSDSYEKLEKTKQLITSLIDLTIHESNVYFILLISLIH